MNYARPSVALREEGGEGGKYELRENDSGFKIYE
jgi:hypothetical protein